MKLMFLTLAPLSSNAGHLVRLSGELYDLSRLNEISIVCLGNNPDDKQIKNKYKNVLFFHFPAKLKGWEVINISGIINNINNLVDKICPDAVILQMEIWDLMRELGEKLKNKTTFITIVHAMPFLVAPVDPSGNFKRDVIKYIGTKIEKYRKDYIFNHYREVRDVFRNVSIVANNRTVSFYFKTYFKNLKIWTLAPSIVVKTNKNVTVVKNLKYDFAYMARMEAGKGTEYLSEILKRIHLIVKKPISVAILGRADDALSKDALERLLQKSHRDNRFNVSYFGWADSNRKKQILSESGTFIYPSHYDNYPTVLNEALTFGLPCVVWDVLFSRLNYSHTKAVKRVFLLDFKLFAEKAVEAFKNRDKLTKYAISFVNSFDSLTEMAKLDIAIFKEIIDVKNGQIKSSD